MPTILETKESLIQEFISILNNCGHKTVTQKTVFSDTHLSGMFIKHLQVKKSHLRVEKGLVAKKQRGAIRQLLIQLNHPQKIVISGDTILKVNEIAGTHYLGYDILTDKYKKVPISESVDLPPAIVKYK